MTQQALKRLIQAAQRRDTIMGDVSSLLAAKAELAAAAKAAETAIAETEIWVPIPYKPGNPQPRIKDGVYRGIRIDGKGGFEGLLKAAAAPDLNYNANEKGIAIWRYLDQSTAHLPPELRSKMDRVCDADGASGLDPTMPVFYSYTYGWFMPVSCEKDADPNSEASYPEALRKIRIYARDHQVSLVRFDSNGIINTELPLFEECQP